MTMHQTTRRIVLLAISSFFLVQAFSQSVNTRLILADASKEIPFVWRGDSMFARWEPHAYLMIPVKLTGCPRTFYMQFDTGSPYLMLYKNTMEKIAAKYPAVMQQTPAADTLAHFEFAMGPVQVNAEHLPLKAFGDGNINWDNMNAPITIGTIGTDLLNNSNMLINYPAQTIRIGIELPEEKAVASSPLVYMFGRILFPVQIKGKQTMLFFDTGSSAFGLLTDKPTAESLSLPGMAPVVHHVNSWGKQLSVFTLPSADSVAAASKNLPLRQVSYVEAGINSTQAEQMRRMGVGGVTGNALFTRSVLFVDTKKKLFAVW